MNKGLSEWFFPLGKVAGFSELDGSVLFYNVVNGRLKEGDVVLDFGAGRGCGAEGKCAWRKKLTATEVVPVRRIAVDVDPVVMENAFAAERHVMELKEGRVRIPLEDGSVDVVICDWVVEHLPDAGHVFGEFFRVLKPGGMVAVRTSNRWHYAYLAARLLGNGKLSGTVLKRVQPGRKDEDVFPKLYRTNTKCALKRAFDRVGFGEAAVFTWDGEPAYVGNSFLGGVIGMCLHRLALLGVLPKASLMGFAVKR